MTRIRITGLDKDIKELRERVFKAIEDSNFEKRLAIDVRAKVRKDGIEPNLAPSTKKFRSRVASKKGPGFSPNKSSLTLSGQLLASLITTFQRTKTKAGFYFGVKDAIHRPYTVNKKLKKFKGFTLSKTSFVPTKKTQIKKSLQYKTGGKSRLVDIFDGLMKDRPITKVFDDQDFKRATERKLVATIKRFFK